MNVKLSKDQTKELCVFELAGSKYGIDIRWLKEVSLETKLTPIPKCDPAIAGLMNLRGQILISIDLHQRLNLSSIRKEEFACLWVVDDDTTTGLIADKIDDIIAVHEKDFEVIPSTLNQAQQELLRGAYKRERDLVVEIAPESILKLGSSNGEENGHAIEIEIPHEPAHQSFKT